MTSGVFAIVPAAGVGKRFSSSVKKTFASVRDVPLIVCTLKRLALEEMLTEIVPVLGSEDIGFVSEMVSQYQLKKIRQIIAGGRERQDSIYNGLRYLGRSGASPDSIILVHDGVRPFIPRGLVSRLIAELRDHDGVIPGTRVKETLKEIDPSGIVLSTIDRERFRSVQTPQAFTFGTLKAAYDAAMAEGYYATDDAALVERRGGRVKIIAGDPYNIKVTTPEDIEMADWILGRNEC